MTGSRLLGWLVTAGLVLAGVTGMPVAQAATAHGYVDSVSVTAKGYVEVSGWAQDPDAPDAPVAIHVYAVDPGGNRSYLGDTVANRVRDDVGAHGYLARVEPVFGGTQTIEVYAIDAAGGDGNSVLPSSGTSMQVAPPHPNPSMYLQELHDARGHAVVTGVALDANAVGPVTVKAKVDGKTVARVKADRTVEGRDDGFRIRAPHGRGAYELCVVAVNVGAGSNDTWCLMMPATRITDLPERTRKTRVDLGWKIRGNEMIQAKHADVRWRLRHGDGWSGWKRTKSFTGIEGTSITTPKLRQGRIYCFSVRASVNMPEITFAWSTPRCVTRRA